MSLDNEERQFYESELKSFLNHAEDIRTAEEKGLKAGEKKKSLEIARNAATMGMKDEDIAVLTGLTVEEIKELKETSK